MTNTNSTNDLPYIPGSRLPGEGTDQWAIRVYRSGWVPACGGSEQPFHYRGKRILYVVDLARGEHGYCDLGTDIVYQTLDDCLHDRLWVDPRDGVANYE
jgi:hypothetical protein